MQTVKINTSSNTMILHCDSITIARKGQLMFDSAIKDAINNGCKRPEQMICNGGITEIENSVYRDDRDIYVHPRYEDDADVIGLVVLPSDDKNSLSYLFIYSGESVYVMNGNGSTIEVLK